ncbi:MAG: VCBS repeat-containing protein [Sedimentisphaerales bacterium]|nr:VCBS repeat-containing protein [Sedimentisphaerales bacterium]
MDLNGDGYNDILSGSWPGAIYFFKGGPDNTFAAPEKLKDKNGELINVGGEIETQPDGRILIRGDAEFVTENGKTYVVYRGEKIESTPEKPLATTGLATAVCATDWDDDGDFDLVIGNTKGTIYLVPNEGTSQSFKFGEEKAISKVSSRAGPCVVDWDGDGDMDILSGANDGSVSLIENKGDRKSPKLAQAVEIVPKAEGISTSNPPKEAKRGNRSKICVADWNGDGKKDLLVGDITYQKPDVPEPTPEQKAEYDKIRKELEPIEKEYSQLLEKITGPSRGKTQEEIEKVNQEMSKIIQHMSELRNKLPSEYEHHGWVWLFLRK